jgi:hypothetical protein
VSPLTAPIEDGVREYIATPANFDTVNVELIEADAFRAGAEWALSHIDGRVLIGLVPGPVEAQQLRIGDRVRVVHGEATVISRRMHGRPGSVYIGTRTDLGAEVVHEFRTTERVQVLSTEAAVR